MQKLLILLALAACVALPARMAWADIIQLKNGNKLEGVIVKETEDEIKLKTTVGSITLKKDDIVKIERGLTALQQFENTVKTLKDDDTVAHYTLGVWCKEHSLTKQAREEFTKVVAADPENADAHRQLGHVLQGGTWMTEDDAMKAKGFVWHQGKWITKKEADSIKEKEKKHEWTDKLRRAARLLDGPKSTEGARVFESITPAAIINPTVVIAALRDVTENEGPAARKEAIKALVRLHTSEAFDAIIEVVLNEKNPEVAQAAANELKALNPKRAARQLARAIRDLRHSLVTATNEQKPDAVRGIERACRALGSLGEPMAVPDLAECVMMEVNYIRDKKSASTLTGPLNSTTESTRNVNGVPVDMTTSSGVSISTSVPDTELMKYYYSEDARNALRQLTGQRFDFERAKWLGWWAANKPVLPPEETEFDL